MDIQAPLDFRVPSFAPSSFSAARAAAVSSNQPTEIVVDRELSKGFERSEPASTPSKSLLDDSLDEEAMCDAAADAVTVTPSASPTAAVVPFQESSSEPMITGHGTVEFEADHEELKANACHSLCDSSLLPASKPKDVGDAASTSTQASTAEASDPSKLQASKSQLEGSNELPNKACEPEPSPSIEELEAEVDAEIDEQESAMEDLHQHAGFESPTTASEDEVDAATLEAESKAALSLHAQKASKPKDGGGAASTQASTAEATLQQASKSKRSTAPMHSESSLNGTPLDTSRSSRSKRGLSAPFNRKRGIANLGRSDCDAQLQSKPKRDHARSPSKSRLLSSLDLQQAQIRQQNQVLMSMQQTMLAMQQQLKDFNKAESEASQLSLNQPYLIRGDLAKVQPTAHTSSAGGNALISGLMGQAVDVGGASNVQLGLEVSASMFNTLPIAAIYGSTLLQKQQLDNAMRGLDQLQGQLQGQQASLFGYGFGFGGSPSG